MMFLDVRINNSFIEKKNMNRVNKKKIIPRDLHCYITDKNQTTLLQRLYSSFDLKFPLAFGKYRHHHFERSQAYNL